jgi:hypothetical protein
MAHNEGIPWVDGELPANSRRDPIRRPQGVTLSILLVLSLVVLNSIRLIQALGNWEILESFRPGLPVYLAISAVLWICAGLLACWGLWRGSRWAPLVTCIFWVAYLAYFWVDYLFIRETAGRVQNLVFLLTCQLALLIVVIGLLSRPAAKQYFRRNI